MNDWEKAKLTADKLDEHIINTLKSGKSFLVEAGAGAGKTHSLMRVIDWLEQNNKNDFQRKGLRVACITYTNAAVDVIKERLGEDSFIKPCTIHTFSWGLIKQFQSSLIKNIAALDLLPENAEKTGKVNASEVRKVTYDLGVKQYHDGELFLTHDDVIKLFSSFLDNPKFRKLLAAMYPVILIDEYQDSFKLIMDNFLKYFIECKKKPQFGLFGDAWQTIYSSSGACGQITSDHLVVINKKVNFRSQKIIVDVLNNIRPELPQISASQNNDGAVYIITNDDFTGERQKKYYSGELPYDYLFPRVNAVRKKLSEMGWNHDWITLMLTHTMLANELHYEHLLKALGDYLKSADDDHLLFFLNTVEPMYQALDENNPKLLFNALEVERKPIESIAEKKKWKNLYVQLKEARTKTILDVLQTIQSSELIDIPDKVAYWMKRYEEDPSSLLYKTPIKDFYSISYSEVLHAIAFLQSGAGFSTEHGAKGEEYESVLMIMGRGWNLYKFDEVLYKNPVTLVGKDLESYIRNRNLFYVCCSRAKKNLAIFITVPVKDEFRRYLEKVFGADRIMNYPDFINM